MESEGYVFDNYKLARDYKNRLMEAETIENKINHLSGDSRIDGRQLIRSDKKLFQSLESIGYYSIANGTEGTLFETEKQVSQIFMLIFRFRECLRSFSD